jgi:hypothetical protein
LHDEIEIFDLECTNLWTKFLKGSPPEKFFATDNEDFEFGGAMVTFLQVVALLWGTFKMFDDVTTRLANFKKRQTEIRDELLKKWTQYLTEAGLSPEVAADIVETHGLRAAKIALTMLARE